VNGAPYRTEPTLVELVSDLANDAKQLLRQELALAKYEIREEIRKAKSALISLGIGIGLAAIGGLLLIVMLVHVLNAFAGLPLWSCYAIVGGVCAIMGIVLLYKGKYRLAQIDMIPQQTVETMKENVRWIKESSTLEKI
jgi:hypothetical protein